MSYLGGKSRRAQHIVDLLNRSEFDGLQYLEPFVGYAHILRRVSNKSDYFASDSNRLLIHLLHAVQNNVEIPHVEREEYYDLRNMGGVSLKRAAAAFTYSYKGGAWKSYFHIRRGRCYSDEHRRYYARLNACPVFRKTTLQTSDYRVLTPVNMLIYCDPPYVGTTPYEESGHYDTDEFWEYMRKWSLHNIVFVSESRAPSDFVCLFDTTKLNNYTPNGKPKPRVERVFVHRDTHAEMESGALQQRLQRMKTSKLPDM